jgi:hypothetical protein
MSSNSLLLILLTTGPNNTAQRPPEYCAPTEECLMTRFQSSGNICQYAQGTYEPVVCPAGSFCSGGGQEITLCPSGHFCPLGTSEPFKCSLTSICPGGSERQFVMDGFITIIIIDVVLLALAFNAARKPLQLLRRFLTSDSLGPTDGLDTEDGLSPIKESEMKHQEYGWSKDFALQDFASSVQRCVGTHEVGISYKFNDISLTLKGGKSILAPQSGYIEKGSLWGVMGESGAGKSECSKSSTAISD